jgi:hypothetical protein
MREQTEVVPKKLDSSTQLAVDRTRLAYERVLMAWIRTATLLIKPALLFGVLFSVAVAAFPQDPNPNFSKELEQETPQQQKQEAQKPDAKASAGDLAKTGTSSPAPLERWSFSPTSRSQIRVLLA